MWDTSELTKAGIEFPFHLPFGRKLSDVSSSRGCQWIAPECILQLSDHALGLATKMDPALDMEVIIPQVDGFFSSYFASFLPTMRIMNGQVARNVYGFPPLFLPLSLITLLAVPPSFLAFISSSFRLSLHSYSTKIRNPSTAGK